MTRPALGVHESEAGRVGRAVGERLPDAFIVPDSRRQLQVVRNPTGVATVASRREGDVPALMLSTTRARAKALLSAYIQFDTINHAARWILDGDLLGRLFRHPPV